MQHGREEARLLAMKVKLAVGNSLHPKGSADGYREAVGRLSALGASEPWAEDAVWALRDLAALEADIRRFEELASVARRRAIEALEAGIRG